MRRRRDVSASQLRLVGEFSDRQKGQPLTRGWASQLLRGAAASSCCVCRALPDAQGTGTRLLLSRECGTLNCEIGSLQNRCFGRKAAVSLRREILPRKGGTA